MMKPRHTGGAFLLCNIRLGVKQNCNPCNALQVVLVIAPYTPDTFCQLRSGFPCAYIAEVGTRGLFLLLFFPSDLFPFIVGMRRCRSTPTPLRLVSSYGMPSFPLQ
jgi:hypothetical protein